MQGHMQPWVYSTHHIPNTRHFIPLFSLLPVQYARPNITLGIQSTFHLYHSSLHSALFIPPSPHARPYTTLGTQYTSQSYHWHFIPLLNSPSSQSSCKAKYNLGNTEHIPFLTHRHFIPLFPLLPIHHERPNITLGYRIHFIRTTLNFTQIFSLSQQSFKVK
jgi:hypothetical protein